MVRGLHDGKPAGVDEMLKALAVFEVRWRLFNVAWKVKFFWTDYLFLKWGTTGCVPDIKESLYSVSLEKPLPVYWRGDSVWQLNLGFRKNNADSSMVVERWTNSSASYGCEGLWGHSLYMCFCEEEYGLPELLLLAAHHFAKECLVCDFHAQVIKVSVGVIKCLEFLVHGWWWEATWNWQVAQFGDHSFEGT